ncbi:hypothetical protein RU639_004411 [Aspergillus parasiticus]
MNSKPSRRKRSRQACLLCHDRKIRCDATGGIPCTNCRWFKRDCIIPKYRYEKRGREGVGKPRKSKPQWSGEEDKARDINDSPDYNQAGMSAPAGMWSREELDLSGRAVSPEPREYYNMCVDVEVQNVTLPQDSRYFSDTAIAVLESAITAETSHGTGLSANGSMSQQASCIPSDATIPAWSTPRNPELDHAAACGTTTSFLSSVNLMPEERALLVQLSSASGYLDPLANQAYFDTSEDGDYYGGPYGYWSSRSWLS